MDNGDMLRMIAIVSELRSEQMSEDVSNYDTLG